jgi:choline dehydrogenase
MATRRRPDVVTRQLGIDVVVDLPGVGENLQNHIEVPLVYRASRHVQSGKNNHGEVFALLRTSEA